MRPASSHPKPDPVLIALALALITTGMMTYAGIGLNLLALGFESTTGASLLDSVWDALIFTAAGCGVTHYVLIIVFLFSLPAGTTQAGSNKNPPIFIGGFLNGASSGI